MSAPRGKAPLVYVEELVATSAKLASLTSSLIDRNAARAHVDRALALSAPAEAADTSLICAKGLAGVSSLETPAATPVKRPRLWLRLSASERRRINLVAAFLGQSTAAFLREALVAFMDNLLPVIDPLPQGAGRTPFRSSDRPVKIAFRVDAAVHAAVHLAAARRGESVQALLVTAIDVHLARLIDAPASKNLCRLLDAFDAATAERAAERASGRGADVIDFPTPPRALLAAPSQRRAAR
jgi:hypothetical protein